MLNVINNLIPHKNNKLDYESPKWIDKSIKLSLKKQSKLIKIYHRNPTANDKEALDIKAKKCTSPVIESEEW